MNFREGLITGLFLQGYVIASFHQQTIIYVADNDLNLQKYVYFKMPEDVFRWARR